MKEKGDVGDRIVNSGIPICLIATLRRLLNFLVELFGDEASGRENLSRRWNQKRNRNVFTGEGKGETTPKLQWRSPVALTAPKKREKRQFSILRLSLPRIKENGGT